MGHAIEIKNLKKYYKDVKAVDDISFSVEEGEFFAFLGVNGAGKSTTISVISGKAPADEGEVKIMGFDPAIAPYEIGNRLGVVFQNSVLDSSLSVYDNLKYRAALYSIKGAAFQKRLEELKELFELEPILKRPVGKLSGGQRRKCDIARALVHEPSVLILDEPTTGLDPQTRKSVYETVHRLRREKNMTVLLTTHYMEEAADADRVVIIDGGKIMANATPLELKEQYTGDFITLYRADEDKLKGLNLPYERAGDGFRIEVKDTKSATELILKHPDLFVDYEVVKGKMDDVFLAVTGKKGGDI
ncbi:MAG: ABC transporter ATP-binding protein [Clostridia bacterium]|nr:ABC transporter ATP-binding protein [Clostridia bacterium]